MHAPPPTTTSPRPSSSSASSSARSGTRVTTLPTRSPSLRPTSTSWCWMPRSTPPSAATSGLQRPRLLRPPAAPQGRRPRLRPSRPCSGAGSQPLRHVRRRQCAQLCRSRACAGSRRRWASPPMSWPGDCCPRSCPHCRTRTWQQRGWVLCSGPRRCPYPQGWCRLQPGCRRGWGGRWGCSCNS